MRKKNWQVPATFSALNRHSVCKNARLSIQFLRFRIPPADTFFGYYTTKVLESIQKFFGIFRLKSGKAIKR